MHKKVLTDLAFIEIKNGKFYLLERAPGVSVEEIISLTEGELVVEWVIVPEDESFNLSVDQR